MRGKRSKQYRKLMQQYGITFGFREPYQVLIDAELIKDADRFKMDLIGGLERTLHGPVKPMITQCCMRHLYSVSSEPGMAFLIDKAKTYERRRCGHRPEEYSEPLSATECLRSVVDPKGSRTNKHRYVIAANDESVRKEMRGILGVPLVYIKRSVMIMEPMAGETKGLRGREENSKFREGLKKREPSGKRKREDDDEVADKVEGEGTKKQRKAPGPKGPNPLSVKKSKKKTEEHTASKASKPAKPNLENEEPEDAQSLNSKRKRIRKHKSNGGDGAVAEAAVAATGVLEVAESQS